MLSFSFEWTTHSGVRFVVGASCWTDSAFSCVGGWKLPSAPTCLGLLCFLLLILAVLTLKNNNNNVLSSSTEEMTIPMWLWGQVREKKWRTHLRVRKGSPEHSSLQGRKIMRYHPGRILHCVCVEMSDRILTFGSAFGRTFQGQKI